MLVPIGILLVAGAAVWSAGTRLSRDADALANSSVLGRVFIGALLLGVATSLPEIATTVTAGAVGNSGLATGNLLGGVAAQVVVLALADAVHSDRRLTSEVSNSTVLVQHVALLLLLLVAIAGMAAGEPASVAGVGVWALLLVVLYVGTLFLVWRNEDRDTWHVGDRGPGRDRDPRRDADDGGDGGQQQRPPALRLAALAGVILVAGWLVARAGDALAESTPLGDTFAGAALVAITTSLPEVSTVFGSLRTGSYDMAVANIAGTNALEVALLAVADGAYREGALLDQVGRADVFLAALAAVLTCIYLAGLLLRGKRTVLRIGYDSAAVVLVYVAGVAVVAAMG